MRIVYDEITVEGCRSGERIVNGTFREMERKVPPSEIEQRRPAWYLFYSQLYFGLVESQAAARAVKGDQTINDWLARDEEKDRVLANAHVEGSMYCRSCGKDMRVISKNYMRREGRNEDDILLMFECDSCNKRQAYWQDGTEWEGAKTLCEKCGESMDHTGKTDNKIVTITYKCPKCGHSYQDSFELGGSTEEEPPDPNYELDNKRFVFDSDMMFKYEQKRRHLERLMKLEATVADQAVHTDIYETIKDIKKLKIAQLAEILKPILEKASYTEFKLDQPQLGREVAVGFSCLDAKPEREEYNSKKDLQKLIGKTLEDTNWRLMSEGVSYRVGYLTGRLRAYESEDELRKLIEQKAKHGTLPPPTAKQLKNCRIIHRQR